MASPAVTHLYFFGAQETYKRNLSQISWSCAIFYFLGIASKVYIITHPSYHSHPNGRLLPP